MQISQGSDSKDQNLTSPPLHTCFCLIVKEGSHPDPTQPTLDTCQVHADWPLARGYTGQSAQFHQKPSSEIPWALSSKLLRSKLISILFKIRDVVYVQITNISLASRLMCRSRSLTAVTSHRVA